MDEAVAGFLSRYKSLGLSGTPATPQEVLALERQFGVMFPAAYKAFLLILGRDGGTDFVGSDCTVRHLTKLREEAQELLRSSGSQFELPEDAFVFLMHQGYSFAYFQADGKTEDPAVFSYLEGDPRPVQMAETFSAWLQL
jgi:hypothetical protein